jgi:hypothetical protein
MLGEALGCLYGAGIERKRGSSTAAVMAAMADDDVTVHVREGKDGDLI